MAEGVVDHVGQCLLEAKAIRLDHESGVAVDHEGSAGLGRTGPEAFGDRPQQVADREPLQRQRQPAVLRAGDDQEVLGELDQAVDLLQAGGDRGSELLLRFPVPERQLELSLVQRQRRAKLVAGVVDEAALALQRGIDPRQHLVQRQAEPP